MGSSTERDRGAGRNPSGSATAAAAAGPGAAEAGRCPRCHARARPWCCARCPRSPCWWPPARGEQDGEVGTSPSSWHCHRGGGDSAGLAGDRGGCPGGPRSSSSLPPAPPGHGSGSLLPALSPLQKATKAPKMLGGHRVKCLEGESVPPRPPAPWHGRQHGPASWAGAVARGEAAWKILTQPRYQSGRGAHTQASLPLHSHIICIYLLHPTTGASLKGLITSC